ncbi:hypothetical protein [Salinivibrio costicola]|uniref:hypothetical protein n=1 Tax=Salinivibrio costicola TaxID=51367 RepID=UPI00046F1831|nr:hypothetical protein [Salinivibrio costicola]
MHIASGRLSQSRLIVSLNVGWRAAQITPSLYDRVGAYADLHTILISAVPLAYIGYRNSHFWPDDTIGVGDTSPSTVLDMCKLPTGACHDRGNCLVPMSDAPVARTV